MQQKQILIPQGLSASSLYAVGAAGLRTMLCKSPEVTSVANKLDPWSLQEAA